MEDNRDSNEDGPVWATVTFAAPTLVEWQIDGLTEPSAGRDIRPLLATLHGVAPGREIVVRLSLLVSL